MYIFVFFFSSRRRHTRSLCDWSSDVCSSDLWQKIRDSVEVKLYQHEGDLYVLAKSDGRQAKEIAMRRKRLARLLRKLRAMRRSLPGRDQLLLRMGAAKKEAGRAFGFVKICLPLAEEKVTRQTFTFRVDKEKLKKAQ